MKPNASSSFSIEKPYQPPLSKSSLGSYKNNARIIKQSSSIESQRRKVHSTTYKKSVSRFSMFGKSIAEENMAGYGMLKGNIPNQTKLRVAFPQRVQLPVYFNTPRRDDLLVDYSKYRVKTPSEIDSSYMYNKPALEMSCTDSYHRVAATKRIRDFQILSLACKRSKKLRDEGRAYYSCGVLYDNLGQHIKAINEYQKFLSVCTNIGDTHGILLSRRIVVL